MATLHKRPLKKLPSGRRRRRIALPAGRWRRCTLRAAPVWMSGG
jgi:hypothetical protein